jgi:hypothetical protein
MFSCHPIPLLYCIKNFIYINLNYKSDKGYKYSLYKILRATHPIGEITTKLDRIAENVKYKRRDGYGVKRV